MTRDSIDEIVSAEPSPELRRRAEIEAKRRLESNDAPLLSHEEATALVHELQVHQIELELQNEQLRAAQLALDTSRRHYFDLFELAPIGYITLSYQGSILAANLMMATMLGVPRRDLIGQQLSNFILPESQDAFYRHRRSLGDSFDPQVSELRLRRGDGEVFWVRLEASAVKGGSTVESTYRAALSDISETRALHDEVVQADRMASLGVMAASVGHEINNPLTYVLHHLEGLAGNLPRLSRAVGRCLDALGEHLDAPALAELLGEDAALLEPAALDRLSESAELSWEGANRIRRIASGLGTFSRTDRKTPGPVDLNVAVQHAINMTAHEFRGRGTVHPQLGKLPPVVATDGGMAQVFLNLLINAAQAMKDGEGALNHIAVQTWAQDDYVYAAVTDTGCGIPREDLDRVFETFFTTKPPDQGTGLGLSVTRRIVTSFGGTIRVESSLGQGARFELRFPASCTEQSPQPSSAAETPTRRGRILAVDDEPAILWIIENMLSVDHDVVTVGSGEEAQALLAKDSAFDLVLCDLMMPQLSGVEVHAWLTQHHADLARRLVFVTGGAYTARSQAYLRTVPNVCIEKPFTMKELRRSVAALVASAT